MRLPNWSRFSPLSIGFEGLESLIRFRFRLLWVVFVSRGQATSFGQSRISFTMIPSPPFMAAAFLPVIAFLARSRRLGRRQSRGTSVWGLLAPAIPMHGQDDNGNDKGQGKCDCQNQQWPLERIQKTASSARVSWVEKRQYLYGEFH